VVFLNDKKAAAKALFSHSCNIWTIYRLGLIEITMRYMVAIITKEFFNKIRYVGPNLHEPNSHLHINIMLKHVMLKAALILLCKPGR
jgi:hypothetical protein